MCRLMKIFASMIFVLVICSLLMLSGEEIEFEKVVNAAIKSVNVGINTTVKYSLTQNGFSKNADVKVFSNYMPGDVNGDKSVNTRDASALLRYLVGKNDSAVIEALDFNDDDEVSLRDASAILRYLVYRKE